MRSGRMRLLHGTLLIALAHLSAGAMVTARAPSPRMSESGAKRRRDPDQRIEVGDWVDNVDFFRPGGVLRKPPVVLTREAIQKEHDSISPTVGAEQKLSKLLSDSNKMDPAQLRASIQAAVDEARAAGLREDSPPLRRAASLLGVLEQSDGAASAGASDPLAGAMDAIFGEGYAEPRLQDDEADPGQA